jgi:hypothetical protein
MRIGKRNFRKQRSDGLGLRNTLTCGRRRIPVPVCCRYSNRSNARYFPNASAIADHLDKAGRRVREVLWKMEDPRGGVIRDSDLERELVYFLDHLRIQTGIALDGLGLAFSRADLDEAWREFVKSGLQKVVFYPEPGAVGSHVYDYLDSVIEGIRGLEPESARINNLAATLLILCLFRASSAFLYRRLRFSRQNRFQRFSPTFRLADRRHCTQTSQCG